MSSALHGAVQTRTAGAHQEVRLPADRVTGIRLDLQAAGSFSICLSPFVFFHYDCLNIGVAGLISREGLLTDAKYRVKIRYPKSQIYTRISA